MLATVCVWCEGPLNGEKALCAECRKKAESKKLVLQMGCHLGRCSENSGLQPHVHCSSKFSGGHKSDSSMYSCRGIRADYYTFACLDCGCVNDYDCSRD